jgi:hypothetical protein
LYAAVLTETIDSVPPIVRKAIEKVETSAEKLQCIPETLIGLPKSNPQFVPITLRRSHRIDVRIGPDGLIYVLDYGAFITAGGEPKAFPKDRKLFRIEKR